MSPKKISVLIVDDSAFMRKALKRMLTSDPMITVVGQAKDGLEAVQAVKHLRPDVMTLDIKMPGMDGLQVLDILMKENPVPVLIVSSLTSEGGGITLEALEAGAVDFIDKSSCHTMMDILDIADSLVKKVKVIAGVDLKKTVHVKQTPQDISSLPSRKSSLHDENPSHLVTIGASTGGPMSLEKVLTSLPKSYPGALLVVQHMPIGFTLSFAERLDDLCQLNVKEAQEDDPLLPGHVYIAPGGYHLIIKRSGGKFVVELNQHPRDTLHRPSVDIMMASVADRWPGHILGILLTGMGKDGVNGIQSIKNKGGTVYAQNEETCIVFGMPNAAQQSGYVDAMVPLHKMAEKIRMFNI